MHRTALSLFFVVFLAGCAQEASTPHSSSMPARETTPAELDTLVRQVDALSKKIAALEASVGSATGGLAALDTEMGSVNHALLELSGQALLQGQALSSHSATLATHADRLETLFSDPLKAPLWLYGGDGAPRHVVINRNLSEAVVSLPGGLLASYPLDITGQAEASPGYIDTFDANALYFNDAACADGPYTTTPVVRKGKLYRPGFPFPSTDRYYIPPTASTTPISRGSYRTISGCITGDGGTTQAYELILLDVAAHTYPNPMTVGP